MSPCMASTGYNQGDLPLEYIQDTFQPKDYAFVQKKKSRGIQKICDRPEKIGHSLLWAPPPLLTAVNYESSLRGKDFTGAEGCF